jgi:DNA polymerase-3 subunit beta
MKKAILNSETFAKALELAKKVITNDPTVPILENWHLNVTDGLATITGSDLQTTLQVSYKIDAKENFECTLAPPLLKYLAKVDNQPLVLSFDPESYGVEISESDGRSKFAGENPLDFPRAPKAEDRCLVLQPNHINEFKDLLNYTNKDELRPALTCISFWYRFGKLNLVSSDGNSLKVVEVPEIKSRIKAERAIFNLPPKAAKILTQFKIDSVVTVTTGRNDRDNKNLLTNIGFVFQSGTFTVQVITRHIDENYPQYWNVIPVKKETTFTTQTKPVIKVLDKALVFAHKTTRQVVLSVNGEFKLSATDLDFSNECSFNIPGDYTGKPIEIGFNGVFLKRCLQSFDDEVSIDLLAPNKAAVLRKENTLVLLMPVMLNEYV